MQDMSERIKSACGYQHDQKGSVFPPQVCGYCMGCPIGTLVIGVSDSVGAAQKGPTKIPQEHVEPVGQWLDSVMAS